MYAMHAAGAIHVAAIRAAAVRTAAMREACVCRGACFSMRHVVVVHGMIRHR